MPPKVAQAIRWICAATALGMLAPATAAAERAAGISGILNLVRFDTATPGDVRIQLITGLQTAAEQAIGLDTRPATGELFLVTTPNGVVSGPTVITRIYRLDPETAAATFLGALPAGTPPGAGDWPPGGPNGGVVTSVGALGVAVDNSSDAGFDISPSGVAYASLRTATVPNLYTVNLQTGAATLVGGLLYELRLLTILPPPPPAAPAPAPPAGPPPPDLTDPSITVRRVPSRLSLKRFLAGGVSARIVPSEAVRLEVALLGRARAVRIARVGDVVLAERNLRLSAATRRVTLKPSRRLVARARRFTVRLRVIARDAAGNRRTVIKRIRVRPAASG